MINTKTVEKITVECLEDAGVKIELGAQYSIRCQYGQIENTVHQAMELYIREFVRQINEDGQLSGEDMKYLFTRLKEYKSIQVEMGTSDLKKAIERVIRVSDSHYGLNDELRESMRIVAKSAKHIDSENIRKIKIQMAKVNNGELVTITPDIAELFKLIDQL